MVHEILGEILFLYWYLWVRKYVPLHVVSPSLKLQGDGSKHEVCHRACGSIRASATTATRRTWRGAYSQ
jgi:hypothetical protein